MTHALSPETEAAGPLARPEEAASPLFKNLRQAARSAPDSGIVEVMNYGRDRPGMIPLWAGEGDLSTPDFICAAATKSLAEGETFYTWQRGIPPLREALARYHSRVFSRDLPAERFFITGSGMQAIQLAIAAVAGAGDEVLIPTPAWPNCAAATGLAGARAVEVPMRFADNSGWRLDLDDLFAAVTPATRAIFVNSPSNPTGWTADEDELRALLSFAREKGLWIIADEVYHRFYFSGERSPSFYDVAGEDDPILFVNTFSKNWAMTGWRVGWIGAPPVLGRVIENLIQYSTSGVAVFMQRAATVALDEGEDFVRLQVDRARQGRQIVCEALQSSPRVRFSWPDGAFYLFFSIRGAEETGKLGLRLVDEANIGLAPGTAFGAGGETFMRLCFARKAEDLSEAARRLTAWLAH
ncbi:pyridoxal phosphate-dependent aminotransferase [Afifella sp. IM 167]|uniref:pyridoxal phosphate-dependent aminotransferase n=1 Tax=Afifella sp. IM 167 TaxID=2033586 RepID=UPI001CCF12AF|nr:pyridoxal phosphate-dependent aminotransferase [Afifella sp. IM 167]MBZ8133769.1 aspartate aminotransferase [Afifella sp. IM 167]